MDGDDEIRIHCPLYLQQLSIAGYPTIKTWLKFNGYASTHCTMSADDTKNVLDFLNTLAMHVSYVAEVDTICQDIIDEQIPVILP